MTLTTNGLLLETVAGELKTAGVERLNVSLDSLDPQIYRQITRGGELDQVLAGLDAAEQAGLRLKLNMVVMRGINDHEVERLCRLELGSPLVRSFHRVHADHPGKGLAEQADFRQRNS